MSFDPVNELEEAMLLAASNESARPNFFRVLLASDLWALGELTDRISLEMVENNGKKYHPVFTSEGRIGALPLPRPIPRFAINGRLLFASTRGADFVINPGSEVSKTLSPEEIAWMLDRLGSASGNLIVAQPKVFPKRLVKALSVLFTSRARIKAAHLVYVAREGIDKEGHPMIGLVADGDVPRLADEIFQAGAEALPGTIIDVVWLNPDGPLDPLQKHLLSIAPFYRRTATLN